MNKEQRINIKLCVKNGKSATETLQMLKIAYGDKCLSKSQVFEWHRRFREGRVDVDDDERSGRPVKKITEENVKKVRDFLKISKTSSVRFMEAELGISKTIIHRILTGKLGIRKKVMKHPDMSVSVTNKEKTDKLEESDLLDPSNVVAVKIEDNSDEEEELPKPAAITLQVMHEENPEEERTSRILPMSSFLPKRHLADTGWCWASSTNRKKYECDECGMILSATASVRNHKLAVHLRLRPYQCDICNTTFTQEVNLKKHKLTHHTFDPLHQSDLSDLTFMKNKDLKTYKPRRTGEGPHHNCDVLSFS